MRKIAVVTGSRAEFGLLQPVLAAIHGDARLELQTIVAGAHLLRGTWEDVRGAGLKIAARVRMQKEGRTGREADVAALARGVAGFGRVFERLRPEIVVALGDRIEVLAAACAASVGGLHLAHIHGGDRAEGVADESMRHAVSKLAHIHLAATETSCRRLVRMGERRDLVFNMGSPAVDGLRDVKPAAGSPELIVLQHPIGGSKAEEQDRMLGTIEATSGHTRLVIAPNDDPGCAGIRAALRTSRVRAIQHLPRPDFLRKLAGARAIVGNSSAGLIEAAILGVPCVNIGPRQAGREKPPNVIDCDYGQRNVGSAIKRALSLDLSRLHHPYGPGGTGTAIAELLATIDLNDVTLRKQNTY